MNKLLVLLVMLVISLKSHAQVEKPVKWAYELRTYGKGEYEVVMNAVLENGWYIFSQTTDTTINGARPTKVKFDNNPGIFYEGDINIFDGKTQEEGQIIETSGSLNVIRYYKDKVSFIQGIAAKKKQSIVSGSIFFTISNGTTFRNLIEKFSFKL